MFGLCDDHVVFRPDDPYPDALARVIRARIEDDHDAVAAELATIRFVPQARPAERGSALIVIAKVYARDHCQCRYCSERVILTAVMRLVSRLYPSEFPYDKNWKADSTHPSFISRSATLDHVRPIARGGDPTALDNLVTACWNCNRRKGDLLVEEVGWSLVEPQDKGWKGLTELFHPLWHAAGQPPLSEDEAAWMRAVSKINSRDDDPSSA
jgi:5-methylcytosine-specific restriction endonuclease McrA